MEAHSISDLDFQPPREWHAGNDIPWESKCPDLEKSDYIFLWCLPRDSVWCGPTGSFKKIDCYIQIRNKKRFHWSSMIDKLERIKLQWKTNFKWVIREKKFVQVERENFIFYSGNKYRAREKAGACVARENQISVRYSSFSFTRLYKKSYLSYVNIHV